MYFHTLAPASREAHRRREHVGPLTTMRVGDGALDFAQLVTMLVSLGHV
jgi:hypothetical protein